MKTDQNLPNNAKSTGASMSQPLWWRIVSFPFWLVWTILTTILNLTGRLLAVVLGFVLLVAGIVVSLTVVGAIVGVPLGFVGILLIIRGLF